MRPIETITVEYEHTDTFGGEANYCWVNRGSLVLPANASERKISRRVKAALGMTGVRCNREEMGETTVLRPVGIAQVIFID